MKTEVLKITPEMALDMLCKNSANRKVRPSRVKYYADQMRAGNWHLTGQGITFAKDGTLLDGQHRLHAIVECEIPQEMLVVYDADKVATYDCGMRRSIADQLQLSGKSVKYSNSVMSTVGLAVVRMYMSIERNGTLMRLSPSADEISEYIDSHYDELDYFAQLAYLHNGGSCIRGARRAVVFATLWAIYNLDVGLTKEDVERIAKLIRDGLALEDGDAPIIGFRNQLISQSRMDDTEVFYRLQYAVYRYLKKGNTLLNKYESRMKYDFTKLKKEETNEIQTR